MKRRNPKARAKRKLKENLNQQPATAAEPVLTHVEREQPANDVELQPETQNLASAAEIQVQAENSVAPADLRGVTENPANTTELQSETPKLARAAESQVEIQNSVTPLDLRDETEDSASTSVEAQTEAEDLARTEEIYAEISSSVAPVEHRDDIEDAASTVELRGEAEDLESILEIHVEVEDSSGPVEIRDVPGDVTGDVTDGATANVSTTPAVPPDTYSSGKIPTSSVAIPIDKEKPAPRTAADRRAHPRYAFIAAIEVIAAEPNARIKSQVRDLSQQGCFVDTDKPLALGTATDVRITKGATNFEARARVVYNQTAKGMGLMFIAVEPQHLRTLDIWISESRESSWRAANRRRSQRVLMKVPVQVSGQAADGATFEESTHTLSISPHGALLVLAAPVRRGQRFILANMQTKSALECVVAHLEPTPGVPMQVGVEFSLPNPAFWRIAFPPKDWTPRHPDAKSR